MMEADHTMVAEVEAKAGDVVEDVDLEGDVVVVVMAIMVPLSSVKGKPYM